MTFKKIGIENREQWLALRQKCVATASTVGGLLTHHPYESPYSIWARAVGLLGHSDENEAMAAGTDAEFMMPARARRLRPNLHLIKNNSFYMDETLLFGATPDFIDTRLPNSIWQAKCTDPSIFDSQWQDGPPLWVELQLQAEMLATGAIQGGILCLVRDRLFSTYLYDREPHEGAQQSILKAVAEMRDRVVSDDPPAKDYIADADIILQGLRKAEPGKIIDLSTDNRALGLIEDYKKHGETIKAAEEKQKALKAELMEKVGDAEAATVGPFRIGAKMIKEAPISYIRKPYRDFRISERKSGDK